jgi:hypothetical protein
VFHEESSSGVGGGVGSGVRVITVKRPLTEVI